MPESTPDTDLRERLIRAIAGYLSELELPPHEWSRAVSAYSGTADRVLSVVSPLLAERDGRYENDLRALEQALGLTTPDDHAVDRLEIVLDTIKRYADEQVRTARTANGWLADLREARAERDRLRDEPAAAVDALTRLREALGVPEAPGWIWPAIRIARARKQEVTEAMDAVGRLVEAVLGTWVSAPPPEWQQQVQQALAALSSRDTTPPQDGRDYRVTSFGEDQWVVSYGAESTSRVIATCASSSDAEQIAAAMRQHVAAPGVSVEDPRCGEQEGMSAIACEPAIDSQPVPVSPQEDTDYHWAIGAANIHHLVRPDWTLPADARCGGWVTSLATREPGWSDRVCAQCAPVPGKSEAPPGSADDVAAAVLGDRRGECLRTPGGEP